MWTRITNKTKNTIHYNTKHITKYIIPEWAIIWNIHDVITINCDITCFAWLFVLQSSSNRFIILIYIYYCRYIVKSPYVELHANEKSKENQWEIHIHIILITLIWKIKWLIWILFCSVAYKKKCRPRPPAGASCLHLTNNGLIRFNIIYPVIV